MKISKILILILLVCSQGALADPDDKNTRPAGIISWMRSFFTPEEIEFDESRRKFMKKGASAGVAVAVTAGGGGFVGSLLEAGRKKLPEALKKKLVALRRVNGDGTMILDAESLEAYREALTKALGNFPQAREAILERIGRLDKVLNNKPLLKSIADTRPSLNQWRNNPFSQARARRRLSELGARVMDIEGMPVLEEAVLAARGLLDAMLLKKMAYQIQLTNPEREEYMIAFTEAEAAMVKSYRALINSLAKRHERLQIRHGFLVAWLPRLQFEADLALELYELSQQKLEIRTCKSFL